MGGQLGVGWMSGCERSGASVAVPSIALAVQAVRPCHTDVSKPCHAAVGRPCHSLPPLLVVVMAPSPHCVHACVRGWRVQAALRGNKRSRPSSSSSGGKADSMSKKLQKHLTSLAGLAQAAAQASAGKKPSALRFDLLRCAALLCAVGPGVLVRPAQPA